MRDHEMRRRGTIGIGGPAKVWYMPLSENELERSLKLIIKSGERFFISGNGSNVLFPDEGFNGVVVRPGEQLSRWEYSERRLTASSGMSFSSILGECVKRGLSGLEFMAGIPATVGGAVKNNASSYGGAVIDVLEKILVLDELGNKVWLSRPCLDAGYRKLRWPGGGTILRAVFSLKETSPKEVAGAVKTALSQKLSSQPCEKRTLGCVFKNPVTGPPAWKLIHEAGMRDEREGGAAVSGKHANFIVNEGNATSRDVSCLVEKIKSGVEKKFGVRLEEEIEIL